jgi:hypothetical protein
MSCTSTIRSAMKTADPNSDESKRRRRHQKLCFADLFIREYPLILGDNPYCVGAPLQLSWKPSLETVVDIDFYEFTRDARRGRKKMHLAGVDREVYLLSIGYSISEIIEASEMGKKVRKERYNSFQNKKWDRFHVVMESAKEKLTPSFSQNQHTVIAKTA